MNGFDPKLQLQGQLQESMRRATTLDQKDPSAALFYYHESIKISQKLRIMKWNIPYLNQLDEKVGARIATLESAGYSANTEDASNIIFHRNISQQNIPGIQRVSSTPNQMPKKPISSNDSLKDVKPPKIEEKVPKASNDMESAIMTEKPNIKFSDVAGLEVAKEALNESIIMPIKLPHLFDKATRPWKGILLYGPPGTGKSYLAKAVAGEATDCTFLTVSNSELTSKWQGESEKLIRQLFETARNHKPSIIFLDEIDSLVTARSDNESEAGRRIKTEFLVQLDGVSVNNDGVVMIGATNTPWDLDPAMRRRFEKRIYIPLPDEEARFVLIKNMLKNAHHTLTETGMRKLAKRTEGFSGADVSIFIREVLMTPIRELQKAKYFRKGKAYDSEDNLRDDLWVACTKDDEGAVKTKWTDLPPNEIGKPIVSGHYFKDCLHSVKPSVSSSDLARYEKWTKEFGEEGS